MNLGLLIPRLVVGLLGGLAAVVSGRLQGHRAAHEPRAHSA